MDESIINIFREYGKQGGKKSLQVQSKEQRAEAGRKGALKRWGTSQRVRRGKKIKGS